MVINMLTRIDVTEEDIKHAEHGSCSHCMLGVALNRVLDDDYGCEVLLDYKQGTEKHQRFNIGRIEKGSIYTSGDFIKYTLKWRDTESFSSEFPEEACDAADKFEGVGDYEDEGESRDIKPFSFYVDIPEKYLRV